MQSLISWEQLLMYVFILLLLYYAVVLLVFYRHDLLSFRTAEKPVQPLAPYASGPQAPTATEERDSVLYNSVHELLEDCKPVFHAAMQQQMEKDQVLDALHLRVQRYPQIKGTAFQIAVTNHIAQEMEHRLSMPLTDTEADDLWL